MDREDQDRLLEKLAAASAELAEIAALETDAAEPGVRSHIVRRTSGTGSDAKDGWTTRDLDTVRSILALPKAPRPYSVSELAALLGTNVEAVRRVLVRLIRERVARPKRD